MPLSHPARKWLVRVHRIEARRYLVRCAAVRVLAGLAGWLPLVFLLAALIPFFSTTMPWLVEKLGWVAVVGSLGSYAVLVAGFHELGRYVTKWAEPYRGRLEQAQRFASLDCVRELEYSLMGAYVLYLRSFSSETAVYGEMETMTPSGAQLKFPRLRARQAEGVLLQALSRFRIPIVAVSNRHDANPSEKAVSLLCPDRDWLSLVEALSDRSLITTVLVADLGSGIEQEVKMLVTTDQEKMIIIATDENIYDWLRRLGLTGAHLVPELGVPRGGLPEGSLQSLRERLSEEVIGPLAARYEAP